MNHLHTQRMPIYQSTALMSRHVPINLTAMTNASGSNDAMNQHSHLMTENLHGPLRRQIDNAMAQIHERDAQLAHLNDMITLLQQRYEAELSQRQKDEREKDSLFTIIEQQTEQWRILSRLLIEKADIAPQGYGLVLLEQASQNLAMVLQAFEQIAQSLEQGQAIQASTEAHFQNTMKILANTKQYLEQISQAESQLADTSLPQSESQSDDSSNILSALTPREQEVFRLLVSGASNSEICNTLTVSESTVRTYRMRIMQKLDVDSFAGLVKFAVKYNLTTLD
ncbi:MAG: LuxR C-terminal-related transcriptional regulator [Chloroflexota bacterium]